MSAHRASHLTIQRWPTALPDEKGERPEFDSLEVYFRRLASLPNESAKAVAEALLKAMFPWKPQPPWQLREDDVQEAVALQKKLGITQGDWGGLVFEAQSRLKVSPRANPTFEPPQQNKLDHRAVIASAVERIEAENEGKKEPKFRLLYNESELFGLVDQAALLGIDAEECAEIILIGCRTAKPRSAEQLKDQMHNLKMVVGKQGHPFKFDNREHLRDLTNRLIDLVGNMTLFQQKIPANDIRIQGSSLRTPLAEDVDIAVFVSEDEFATLCRNRYAGRVKKRGEKADSVLVQMPTTHGGLVELAQLIRKQPKAYSPEAGSFADMLLGGKFDGKTRSSDMALADLTQKIAHEFKSLNIESVTILVRGGPFDLKPYLLLQYR